MGTLNPPMSKLFGFYDDYRKVHLVEGEIVTGTDFKTFWGDKIGGKLIGGCKRSACSESLEDARLGFQRILEKAEADELERLERIRDKMKQLKLLHV